MTRRWIVGAALMATLGGPGIAAAAPGDRPIAATVARLVETGEISIVAGLAPGGPALAAARVTQQPGTSTAPVRWKGARVGRRIAGAAVGALGGAFAGGYLGAAIDGDCGGCDDPGFKGFLIGFPVGGVVGGVLGGLYLFR
jgi:hypothetical protein